MNALTNDSTGTIHVIACIAAMILGSLVLIYHKGSRLHRKIGYAYMASMTTVIVTAFMIYRFFGGFGIFHVAAIISALTLLLGMYPVIRRKNSQWLIQHMSYMYWSVIGLYAAFWSETFTRLLPSSFFWMVGLATGITVFFGAKYFKKLKPIWHQRFSKI